MTKDEYWMGLALSLARSAKHIDEVPVGAVIVHQSGLVSTGFNLREKTQDPSAHAEMIAIRKASKILGSWRLGECSLYVTLEPCLMCAGAIYQSRFKKVVFGASDPKGGAMGSLYSIQEDERLNHRFEVSSGVLADECSNILSSFFRAKRKKK